MANWLQVLLLLTLLWHGGNTQISWLQSWLPGLVGTLVPSLASVSGQGANQPPSQWFTAKKSHQPQLLSNEQLQYVASLSNMQGFDVTLDPILVPRVVGTPNHARVGQYIQDQMASLQWEVDTDRFSARTPLGQKEFVNIVATLDPNAPRRLVLACHYDSKYDPKKETFIGATDSAVPCAMMISLARDMAKELDQFKNSGQGVTLQFIFFDGEEAFVNWDKNRDAIYGARNLADKWSKTRYPTERNRDGTTQLHRMDLLVLLDLLGTSNPQFYSLIKSGDRWYKQMANAEQRLRSLSLLNTGSQQFFSTQSINGGIEDDHIPFMERNVPILHVIPTPFPAVWHTDRDDKSALDYKTIDDLNKILRVFVAEYLQMSV